MRVAPFGGTGVSFGGGRFLVTVDERAALEAAVEHLRTAGFASGDDTFQRLLSETGSEWVAQDLRVGDVKKSWKQSFIAWAAEDTVLEFFRPFWRPVTPSLVVACARASDAGSELVIYPHDSIKGGSDRGDSRRLVQGALQSLKERFSAAGQLVSLERMRGIKNDGSPASQKVVRDLLGWR